MFAAWLAVMMLTLLGLYACEHAIDRATTLRKRRKRPKAPAPFGSPGPSPISVRRSCCSGVIAFVHRVEPSGLEKGPRAADVPNGRPLRRAMARAHVVGGVMRGHW